MGESQPPYLVMELTNICNLRCSYCLRDEDALYHTRAQFLSLDLIRRIIGEARDRFNLSYISFTGGEATLHPRFKEIIEMVAAEELKYSFVTNGWHFDRIYPAVLAHRSALHMVGFSLDGATREAHDRWRGDGSFVRLVRAITRCYMQGLPFLIKVGIRRDTVPQLEQIALFAARMGAKALHFSHFLPTSSAAEDESALTFEERRRAEQEVVLLAKIFKMDIALATGYHNIDPSVPCEALRGKAGNIDYRGRLSLCCNISGYRGAGGEPDVVADLTREDFATGYARLLGLAEAQVERRRQALAAFTAAGQEVDLYTGSPCLFCLQSFGKIPWRNKTSEAKLRSLPILAEVPKSSFGENPSLTGNQSNVF